MFSFIKTLTALTLFSILYYFFFKRPTASIQETFKQKLPKKQTPPDLPKCYTLDTEQKCDEHGAYCKYNKASCVSQCERKQCDKIKGVTFCSASSTTQNQQKEPACVWKNDQCQNCPWDYVMPDPVTKEMKCFYNKCDSLPKDICESPLFNNKCCWNPKLQKCECRSKTTNPKTGQCVAT